MYPSKPSSVEEQEQHESCALDRQISLQDRIVGLPLGHVCSQE